LRNVNCVLAANGIKSRIPRCLGFARHFSGGCVKHLFDEHRAVREMPALAIGRDGPGQCIDDMELLRTLALVGGYRSASHGLIGGAIGIGYMQIASRVSDGLRFRPSVRRGRAHLPMDGGGGHCRYSCHANIYNVDLHDPVLPPGETTSSSRNHFIWGIPMSNKR